MSIKQTLFNLIYGKPVEGENIISRTPTFRTYNPEKRFSFNEIAETIYKENRKEVWKSEK